MKHRVTVFNSKLRDGAQGEGISFSVNDKLQVAHALDALGVQYIECGNPGSNPKDAEFFEKAKGLALRQAKLAAFGSTRRPGVSVQEDGNLQAILEAETPVTVLFGKSWDFHVTEILQTTLEENLKMIQESVAFFKQAGREVIYDAEHFFDGYRVNPDYALATLQAAVEGGADLLCLCDTRGGLFPDEVRDVVLAVAQAVSAPLGIHTHNDGGMAEANAIFAVEAGCTQVQGTLVGFGERCGNANLANLIANLQLKKGYEVIGEEELARLTPTARKIAEIANVHLKGSMPYVGKSAFAHKAGMHVDGVLKSEESFEHVQPESVGNSRRVLMSEVAGRSGVLQEIRKVNPSVTKDSPVTKAVVEKIKEMEYNGYQFEGAESSLELLIRKEMGVYRPFFTLDHYKIIGEHPSGGQTFGSTAVIKVGVGGRKEISVAEGDGPVNALDKALRRALDVFYPSLKMVHLLDYKVRVLDSKNATAAKVRVLIESTDGEDVWTTVGVSADIIEASWGALVDSIEYKLLKDAKQTVS